MHLPHVSRCGHRTYDSDLKALPLKHPQVQEKSELLLETVIKFKFLKVKVQARGNAISF